MTQCSSVAEGTFRDPGGRLYRDGDRILREIYPQYAPEVLACLHSPLVQRWIDQRRMVPTQILASESGQPALLEHERIFFLSLGVDTQGASNVGFAYDSNGRRTSLALPNGVVASYSYDAASQLTGINYQGGVLAPANLTYSYDLAGRRVGVGGSLASTQLPTAVSSAVYNANNQLTQWGTTAMTYDANGNTLADGMNSYVWDARNRLASADNNGASFAYDPLGRRVSKTVLSTTTNFLYDGANAVQEFGTLPTANLLTGGVDERFTRTTATETDNYLTDAQGSTVTLTDAVGNSVAQYSYAPFGSLSASGATTSNSYTYTGRESDGLGINYYQARYYNPTTGRFLSEDPLGFGGGINKYAPLPELFEHDMIADMLCGKINNPQDLAALLAKRGPEWRDSAIWKCR